MAEAFSKVFGTVVRARREASGISQEELAARAGIHRTYVSSVELGKVRLGLEIAKRLASGLGLSLATLISDAESKFDRRERGKK